MFGQGPNEFFNSYAGYQQLSIERPTSGLPVNPEEQTADSSIRPGRIRVRSSKAGAGILNWDSFEIFDLSQPSCANQPNNNNEQGAEDTSRRPETDAGRERKQPVSAGEELFLQGDKYEDERVHTSPSPHVGAAQRDRPEIEHASEPHGYQQTRDGCEAQHSALPELSAEHPAPGQAVFGNGPDFDTPHDPTGEDEDEEVHTLPDEKQGGVFHTMQANHQVAGFDQNDDNDQKDGQPPPGAEFRRNRGTHDKKQKGQEVAQVRSYGCRPSNQWIRCRSDVCSCCYQR